MRTMRFIYHTFILALGVAALTGCDNFWFIRLFE